MDEIRDKILEFLYEYDKKTGGLLTTKERVAQVLHNKFQFDRKEVRRNIEFLLDEKYIKKNTTRTGKLSFEQIRISSNGTQKFEDSKYAKRQFSSVQLQGDNNIVVLGNNLGHIQHNQGVSINELNKLIAIIHESPFSQEDKMNLIGDIETIKGQLLKPKPSGELIKSAWGMVRSSTAQLADISGAHDLIEKIGKLLGS